MAKKFIPVPATALDVQKFLGKPRNRIYRVGVEVEGGWAVLPPLLPGMEIIRDGSVFKTPGGDVIAPVVNGKPIRIGELPSPPLIPIQTALWLKRFYPTHVNSTCGLHVHMSFTRLNHYNQLMTPDYQATVFSELTAWATREGLEKDHPIWARLTGEYEYCNGGYYADTQVHEGEKDYDHFRPGNRYTAIAYRFKRYETIECRILPMFAGWEQAYRAVRHILDVTNACLMVTAKKTADEHVSVAVQNELVVEKKNIYV